MTNYQWQKLNILKLINISLIGIGIQFLAGKSATLEPLELLLWENAAIFDIPNEEDPKIEEFTQEYLQSLKNRGASQNRQGISLHSDWVDFSDHNGNIPLSAASLTKIVTSLASLKTWDVNHRFNTYVYHDGVIENDILNGDLIIKGNGNPLYVWEEAIALGNVLNELGISEVTGDLLILDKFYMNFKTDPKTSAQFLRRGINNKLWNREIIKIYELLPANTPRPYVKISGNIEVIEALPEHSKLLLNHQSLNLVEILRQMNIYSNNYIAQMLADQIGKPEKIRQLALQIADIPIEEINIINGSGLGGENKISSHVACEMMLAGDRYLENFNLGIEDIFPVGEKDIVGTAEYRNIPSGISFKTGTLPSIKVSALAGIIPTTNYGNICFALINKDLHYLDARQQQDVFLNKLSEHWEIIPFSGKDNSKTQEKLGDPNRIILENNFKG